MNTDIIMNDKPNNIIVDEKVFWKVFHNKYLFNLIIRNISLLSAEFEDIGNYYPGSKRKFKNILELDFFFNEKGVHPLFYLKMKFNEEFDVSNDSLAALIKYNKDIQVFEYIFQRYKKNFIQINTFNQCISSENRVAFDFFYDKVLKDQSLLDYYLPVHQSTIENTLQNAELYYVECILKIVPIVDTLIKKFIFKIASSNKNRESIIQFLISNPQYYS